MIGLAVMGQNLVMNVADLARMRSRSGHYMNAAMLQGQFDVLEEPAGVLTVDISQPPEDIVRTVMQGLEHTRCALGMPG